MFQSTSTWIKKSAAIVTLTLTVISSTAPAVSAYSSGGTAPVSATAASTTAIGSSLVAAIYGPTTGVLNNAFANPSTFKPSNGQQTTIHFELVGSATVWLDIMQNGTTVNRLYFNAGRHLTAGSYDTLWSGLDNNGVVVNNGTYQFVVTANLDATGVTYTAQDNIVVTSNVPAQLVTITAGTATPNRFNPSLNQLTFVNYTLNTLASLNIEVVDGSTAYSIGSSPLIQAAGTYSVSWNGKLNGTNAPAKTYFIRFTGTNAQTPVPYVITVPVTVDYGSTTTNPKVLYIYAENASFNPNTTTNRIHYSVDGSSTAVVKILDASSNTVKTFGASSVNSGFDFFGDKFQRDILAERLVGAVKRPQAVLKRFDMTDIAYKNTRALDCVCLPNRFDD